MRFSASTIRSGRTRRSAKGPPAEFYGPSLRDYPERPPEPRGYPDDWQKRKVRGSGQIKWKGRDLRITAALVGHEIDLQPVGEAEWALYFEHLELGRFDERNHRLKPNPHLASTTTEHDPCKSPNV